MKERLYSMPKSSEYVDVPALLETAYEFRSEHITFSEVLNSLYAEYKPVIIRVPASLAPEVFTAGSGEKRIRFNSQTANSKVWPAQESEIRLPIHEGKAYTFFKAWNDDKTPGYDDPSYEMIAYFPIVSAENKEEQNNG